MALQLLIFRHAQAGNDAATDHERSLTSHGEQQAKYIGDYVSEQEVQPDLILCSSATRAYQTMNLAIDAGQWSSDSTILDALYETTPGAVLQLLSQVSSEDRSLMLVGHEPTWSALTTLLSGEPVSFSTAGICCLQFEVASWSEVEPGLGHLLWCHNPG